MLRRFKARLGKRLCDFGLYVLSLGPKDVQDRESYKELIAAWKRFDVIDRYHGK